MKKNDTELKIILEKVLDETCELRVVTLRLFIII